MSPSPYGAISKAFPWNHRKLLKNDTNRDICPDVAPQDSIIHPVSGEQIMLCSQYRSEGDCPLVGSAFVRLGSLHVRTGCSFTLDCYVTAGWHPHPHTQWKAGFLAPASISKWLICQTAEPQFMIHDSILSVGGQLKGWSLKITMPWFHTESKWPSSFFLIPIYREVEIYMNTEYEPLTGRFRRTLRARCTIFN